MAGKQSVLKTENEGLPQISKKLSRARERAIRNKLKDLVKKFSDYRFKKDEIFRRMKVTTFVHLVIQVYQVEQYENFEYDPPDTALTDRPDSADTELANVQRRSPAMSLESGDFGAQSIPESTRSTLLSVARGVGEMDLNAPDPKPATPPPDKLPYLLLDVRDHDEFNKCHIIGAINYPTANLSRATNYEIQIMTPYRNKDGKVVIIYDEDERIATKAAQTLVERGYDNLFLLSGGMKVAYSKFPEGLFTGSIPPTITHSKARYEEKPLKKAFDEEDINKLEIYLENIEYSDQPYGTASRLSKASTVSSRMSNTSSVATNRSGASISSSRPPFR